MGPFGSRWLRAERNLSALANLFGQRIDRVDGRRPPSGVALHTSSGAGPTRDVGERAISVRNARYECTCNLFLFVFNRFGVPATLTTAVAGAAF